MFSCRESPKPKLTNKNRLMHDRSYYAVKKHILCPEPQVPYDFYKKSLPKIYKYVESLHGSCLALR